MEIKRTTEILVEKKRRLVISQPATGEMILCSICGGRMMTAEAAAVLFGVRCRLVYQSVEAGATHFVETDTGALFVCPSSLDQAIGKINDAPFVETVELPTVASEGYYQQKRN